MVEGPEASCQSAEELSLPAWSPPVACLSLAHRLWVIRSSLLLPSSQYLLLVVLPGFTQATLSPSLFFKDTEPVLTSGLLSRYPRHCLTFPWLFPLACCTLLRCSCIRKALIALSKVTFLVSFLCFIRCGDVHSFIHSFSLISLLGIGRDTVSAEQMFT